MAIDTNDGEETGEAIGTGNDARIALMNRISDSADEGRKEEFSEINDDGTTTPFVEPEDAESLADKEESDAEAARLAAEEATQQAPEKHKIKVNGRELELTYDELVARAQKVESADDYLREAARLRNEQNKPLPTKVDAASVDDDLALARAIQMGSEEEAVAALRKLKSSGPSKDDLTRVVDERLTFNTAINKFQTEYADVFSDPQLKQMALDADARLLAAGDSRPYFDRYQDIGNGIRNWVKDLKAPKNDANLQPDKLTRKAAAPAAPRLASGTSQTSVEEEKEESAQEIIQAMAKSRGAPAWMTGKR